MTITSRLDSVLYTNTLPNGLHMLGQYMPSVESAAAVFWVRTGARDEADKQAGISHFLEHMAFKRTKTRTYEDINREFEAMGAENNAFTWLEMTAYWARVLGENLEWAIDLLADLTQPVLDKEDFEQERNVILEEIALYQDRPQFLVTDQFLQDFFHDHPLGHSTLGTPETIKSLTVEDMRTYWRRRYSASNMLFAVAGNFNWDVVVEQVSALTANWHTEDEGRSQMVPHYHPYSDIKVSKRWKQQYIVLGVPSIKRSDPRYYAAAVLATILGDDTGSRLFWSVYQKGLAEHISAQIMPFDDAGVLHVSATTEPAKAAETLSVIRRELEQLQSCDISEDELNRAKIKLMASVLISGESPRARMMGIIESWLGRGRLETLEDIRTAIADVTLDDIQSLLNDYPLTANQGLTALGPLDAKSLGVEEE
jgi:predicted Zn-dependent peptidase